jgi:chromosomal replication initiation ATPase DnaA
MGDIAISGPKVTTPRELTNNALASLAASHGVTLAELFAAGSSRKLAWPRQAAMALLRDRGWSYPQIGRYFGLKHSTVVYGVKQHVERAGWR